MIKVSQELSIGVANAIAVAVVAYFLSINVLFVGASLLIIIMAYMAREVKQINSIYIWAAFVVPQALAILFGSNIGIAKSQGIHLELPYYGVRHSLDYLQTLGLNSRVDSIIGTVELSVIATLSCLAPLLHWSIRPAVSSVSPVALYKLALAFTVAWVLIALLLAAIPLHSFEGCTRRCSNIATSNTPYVNLFLFAQSMFLILPAVIWKCLITSKARSQHV